MIPHRRNTANAVQQSTSLDALKASVDMAEIIGQDIKLQRRGAEYVGLSPFKDERTASFTIKPASGFYHCFASGEHGDIIDYLEKVRGMSFRDALSFLRGGEVSAGAPKIKRQAARIAYDGGKIGKIAKAADIWQSSIELPGTPGETYLRGRGIDWDALTGIYGGSFTKYLRFCAGLPFWCSETGRKGIAPAMVANMWQPGVGFTGVHRTYLAPGGLGKSPAMSAAKLSLGRVSGAGIWLSRPDAHCVIGEGIETTLSVLSDLARDGRRVFGLCGVSLGNIAGAGHGDQPDMRRLSLVLPDGVRQLTLLADADGKNLGDGEMMMRRAANKFLRSGVAVRIAEPRPGADFNDMLQGGENDMDSNGDSNENSNGGET